MSKNHCDSDGFQLVVRRGKAGRRAHHPPAAAKCREKQEYTGPPPDELLARLMVAKQIMENSQFFKDFIGLVQDSCSFTEVVCYGIGNIGTSSTSQHQFALLLAIQQHWKPKSTWVFDPCLFKEEMCVLRQLGCEIWPKNELCKHPTMISTLFYMPHCGKAMYNNLLWANWSAQKLVQVVIIGNSFSSYSERLPSKQLQQEALYIYNIIPYCVELPLPTSFSDSHVFNDTSLHTFPMERLQAVPHSHWEHCTEPILDPTDPEIIAI